MYLKKLKTMFQEMVLAKDASKIPDYYHPEFLLYTNSSQMNYETFLKSHIEYYATPIQYAIAYDEETFLEQGDKLAGRMWITTSRPNEPSTELELILIVQFKEGKIYRVWELSYPDWSQLPAFLKP